MNSATKFERIRSFKISRIFREPVLLFTASRYLGYGMLFVRGILLAKFLGPNLFGVWGFLTLVQQYLSYTNLGIQYAVTVELSTGVKSDLQGKQKMIGGAITVSLFLAIMLSMIGLGIQNSAVTWFERYSFTDYAFLLMVWIGLFNLQHVLINIYRVYNKLLKIALCELIIAVIPLVATFIFRGETLVLASLISLVLSYLITIIILFINSPYRYVLSIDNSIVMNLIKVGVPLLIYNVSYNMITLAGRTILSFFYSNEVMGYYSLANNITNGTLLGFRAILWVMFPTVLFKTRNGVSDQEVHSTINRISELFNTSVYLIVFGMIICSPLLFIILPQFKAAGGVLAVLLLAQSVLLITFGYNALAISRKEHVKVAYVSMAAVVIVGSISLVVAIFKWSYIWIAISVLLGSLVFTILQVNLGSRTLSESMSTWDNLLKVFPLSNILSLIICLIGVVTGYIFWGGLIGLMIYVISSKYKIGSLFSYILYKFT
jgi:O-antigen/teichoic acid export membrane protein